MSERAIAIIPARNEASVISEVITQALLHVDQVVVVDDGSHDQTAMVARIAGAQVVRHTLSRGAGRATATGIRVALKLRGHYLVTLDGDGQHDPAEIPKLLAPLKEDRSDLVLGCRTLQRNSMPVSRRVGNSLANLWTRILFGVQVQDSQSGFRAWSAKAASQIAFEACGYEFCSATLGSAKLAGLRILEVPVTTRYTPYSMAKGQSLEQSVQTLVRIGKARMK